MDGRSIEVKLGSKPAAAAMLASPTAAANLTARIGTWLAARGVPPVDGIAVYRDGSVGFALPAGTEATRDAALAAWAAFDPSAPTTQEAAGKAERDAVGAMLERLDAGTATARETQRALAWLARRVLAGEGG